jgi:hypothetical protein
MNVFLTWIAQFFQDFWTGLRPESSAQPEAFRNQGIRTGSPLACVSGVAGDVLR